MLIAMGRTSFNLLGFNDWKYMTLEPNKAAWLNETPNIDDLMK